MKIADLLVRIGADTKDLEQGFQQGERAAERFSRNVTSEMQRMASSMKSIGTKMSLLITAPLTLIGKQMIQLGMDAVESQNLFSVSMGKMAAAGQQWSTQLSKSLGLNRYEVMKNVGMLKVMNESMGFNEGASFNMAKGITQLAYDMSSFYNISSQDAFEKLRSGLVGESDPLQQLGILVNDNTIKQVAYRRGIAKTGKELTEQQKVLARYYAIMEQTSKAQGDLARTMDSPGNKARAVRARYEELMTTLGMKLLPVFTKLLGGVNILLDGFNRLPSGAQVAILAIGALTMVVGPLLLAFGSLVAVLPFVARGFGMLGSAFSAARAIGLLTGAFRLLGAVVSRTPIGAAITIFVAIIMSSEQARHAVERLMDRIMKLFGVTKALGSAGDSMDISGLTQGYNDYTKALEQATQGIEDTGNAAGDSKKKLDKFLAAFDELNTIPDQNGGGGGGVGGAGSGMSQLPTLPNLPDSGGDLGGNPFDKLQFKMPDIPPFPPVDFPDIKIDPTAPVTAADTVMSRIQQQILAWQPQINSAFGTILTGIALAIATQSPSVVLEWQKIFTAMKDMTDIRNPIILAAIALILAGFQNKITFFAPYIVLEWQKIFTSMKDVVDIRNPIILASVDMMMRAFQGKIIYWAPFEVLEWQKIFTSLKNVVDIRSPLILSAIATALLAAMKNKIDEHRPVIVAAFEGVFAEMKTKAVTQINSILSSFNSMVATLTKPITIPAPVQEGVKGLVQDSKDFLDYVITGESGKRILDKAIQDSKIPGNQIIAGLAGGGAGVVKDVIAGGAKLLPTLIKGASKLVPGFANGGIIGSDSLIRAGEKGRREAIIPLQNGRAMQPYVDAVVSQLSAEQGTAVTPDMIQAAISNAVMAASQLGSGPSGDVVFKIGDTEFVRFIKPFLDKENKRVGGSMITTG